MTDPKAKVAFLGPAGTFSQLAAEKHFVADFERLSVASIDEAFLSVESGAADYAVVPVENSTEGAINITQDCLMDTSLHIGAEVVLAIEHNFLASTSEASNSIKRIVSHRQSFAQCRIWLKANWPGVLQQEVSSNAEAARLASEDFHTAAIAGLSAAQTYKLTILARGIQDRSNNSTRFLVMSQQPVEFNGAAKTSILVYTQNKPGALFKVLEPFEKFGVNLTKIETRPARDDMWAYVFFIDFEGHMRDEAVRNVFAQLQDRTVKIKNLGSYPVAVTVVSDSGNRTESI